MKKALMIASGAFLALIALMVTVGVILSQMKSDMDKESKEYVDSAVPAIITGWNKIELEQRASPEFWSGANDGDLDKLFALFGKLGPLKASKECKGDSNVSVTTGRGKVVSANYICSAEFESGPAEIGLSLIKHGNQWQIAGFTVNSKAFLQ